MKRLLPFLPALLGSACAPLIHDITTDTEDPPKFEALLEARRKSSNGADYGGAAVAAKQMKAYPDIAPLELAAPPAEAFKRCETAARTLGWEVVAVQAPERLEATATTKLMRFKDDIVVRVRPSGSGSRVDVRSVSRLGKGDFGANAKRIRAFLGELRKA